MRVAALVLCWVSVAVAVQAQQRGATEVQRRLIGNWRLLSFENFDEKGDDVLHYVFGHNSTVSSRAKSRDLAGFTMCSTLSILDSAFPLNDSF